MTAVLPVIPAEAGIQILDPGSESGVTVLIPANRTRDLAIATNCAYIEENWMARKKKSQTTIPGGSLLTRGDIIKIMDQGSPVECKVLSCLATEDGACMASIEVLEGERKGERITTKLRALQEED